MPFVASGIAESASAASWMDARVAGSRVGTVPTGEEKVWLVANADGTGHVREIDELRPLSWRGGWYFCECFG
jgi:hypothetical protein